MNATIPMGQYRYPPVSTTDNANNHKVKWQFLPNLPNTVPLSIYSPDWEDTTLTHDELIRMARKAGPSSPVIAVAEDEHPLDKIGRELDEAIEEAVEKAHKQLHRLED